MNRDWVLITWLIVDLIRDLFCLSGGIYLAIWKHCSGWWVVLAIVLCMSTSWVCKLPPENMIEHSENWHKQEMKK